MIIITAILFLNTEYMLVWFTAKKLALRATVSVGSVSGEQALGNASTFILILLGWLNPCVKGNGFSLSNTNNIFFLLLNSIKVQGASCQNIFHLLRIQVAVIPGYCEVCEVRSNLKTSPNPTAC